MERFAHRYLIQTCIVTAAKNPQMLYIGVLSSSTFEKDLVKSVSRQVSVNLPDRKKKMVP